MFRFVTNKIGWRQNIAIKFRYFEVNSKCVNFPFIELNFLLYPIIT